MKMLQNFQENVGFNSVDISQPCIASSLIKALITFGCTKVENFSVNYWIHYPLWLVSKICFRAYTVSTTASSQSSITKFVDYKTDISSGLMQIKITCNQYQSKQNELNKGDSGRAFCARSCVRFSWVMWQYFVALLAIHPIKIWP